MKNDTCGCGPGYATPAQAMLGPREKILYVVCIRPNSKVTGLPDYLATIDVDPESPTYSQVIHRTYALHPGDELHHMGWNTCSSCFGDASQKRNRLILPSLNSDRIYVLDTSDERAPKIHKVIEPEEMHNHNVSFPHTTHCLPSGEVMISTLGDAQGEAVGDFVLIDSTTWTIKGTWTKGEEKAKFGYDFWYQPHHDAMVSTEWAAPKTIKAGLDFKKQSLISDILISMDDRFLYFNNFLHGDVRQYDISDRRHPKLVGQVFVGGKLHLGSEIKVIEDPELKEPPEECIIKGVKVKGGAQMMQLSLDGKRLYVTNSLYTPWDAVLYPDLASHGCALVKIDVDTDKGGLRIDKDFLVNFGAEPGGPSFAHECRYPGGDCTSDIFLPQV
ncbi:unnamed protein product [Nesidiocoris tenuis]|uniref:Methanethiol oxidase n=1 Tax=Nesidiocoris tenuis TaxID=355587 RepID=A0A6H5GKA6_9HEMI|nr:unnamed protein product [Nesidiocoris tenuis]CAB0002021.1 unnamed protein product [Nesidiocoris tenuis]